MTDKQDFRVNCDDLQQKRKLVAWAGMLKGWQRFRVTRSRPARSLNQNAYYFGVVIKALCDWMRDENQEEVSPDEAHRFFKSRFLGTVDKIDKRTGEVLFSEPVDSHTLSTVEFGEFVEKCRDFLADYCGVVTEDPDPNWRTNREHAA